MRIIDIDHNRGKATIDIDQIDAIFEEKLVWLVSMRSGTILTIEESQARELIRLWRGETLIIEWIEATERNMP